MSFGDQQDSKVWCYRSDHDVRVTAQNAEWKLELTFALDEGFTPPAMLTEKSYPSSANISAMFNWHSSAATNNAFTKDFDIAAAITELDHERVSGTLTGRVIATTGGAHLDIRSGAFDLPLGDPPPGN